MTIEVDGFLADSVTAVQGKLYALGAGWNRIRVALFPARHDRVGIGLLFRFPAGSPNERRRFELRVEGPDGSELQLGTSPDGRAVGRLAGEFSAGGTDEQIVPLALNLNGLPIAAPGTFRVVIALAGQDVKVLSFRVEAMASSTAAQGPGTEAPSTGTGGYL